MKKLITALLAYSAICFAVWAYQDIPNLAKNSNWGKLTQDGKKLKIEGDPVWAATGIIRDDGCIYLEWVNIHDGRLGHSVYGLNDKSELIGLWGWCDETEINDRGAITGNTRDDRIYSIP